MTVPVGAATVISRDGAAVALGATVHVVGELAADGSVSATAIQVKMPPPGVPGTVALCGVVTSPPPAGLIGDWQVGGDRPRRRRDRGGPAGGRRLGAGARL
jgi:hypothetical protein